MFADRRCGMDERGRKGAGRRRAGTKGAHGRHPDRKARGAGGQTPGMNGPRMKKSRRAKRQRRNMILRILIVAALIIAAAGIVAAWYRYGSSNERADLEQYYGIGADDEFAVVIDNEVVGAESETSDGQESPAPGRIFDGEYYIEYSVVRDQINKRFYWDPNEKVMLYTLPGGNVTVQADSSEYTEISESKSEDYVILKTEGSTAYIALPFIQAYTNMEYSVYDAPNRAVITSEWGEIETALIRHDTQVRYRGGVKSPILKEVSKSDKVTVLEDEDDWMKVAIEDVFIGYVKTKK